MKYIKLKTAKIMFARDYPDYKIMPDLYFRKEKKNKRKKKIAEIKAIRKKGYTLRQISKMFDLSHGGIDWIIKH